MAWYEKGLLDEHQYGICATGLEQLSRARRWHFDHDLKLVIMLRTERGVCYGGSQKW